MIYNFVVVYKVEENSFREIFVDYECKHIQASLYPNIINKAFMEEEMFTSPLNPDQACGFLYELVVVKGEITRKKLNNFYQHFPVRRLNELEYKDEMDKCLSELPKAFRSYVSHSAGREEVLAIVKDIASDLKPVIRAYDESNTK